MITPKPDKRRAGSWRRSLGRWVMVAGLGLASSRAAQFSTTLSGSSPITLPPFSNLDVIEFPSLDNGPASPYPSTIVVSGQTRAVQKITVTLFSLTHAYPDDIDIILVGPSGQKTYLMSDTGLDTSISGVNLTFDDAAGQSLPDSNPIVSGTYRPTNFGANDPFALPAPAAPYATNLSVFNGTNPNGVWSLYVMDDLPEDSGSFDGWQMTLTVLDPLADLAASISNQPLVGLAGSNLTFVVSVTNRGPATATAILLTSPVPANASFVSATATQGACVQNGGNITCDLGSLAAQASLETRIVVLPLLGGFVTNSVHVSAEGLDLVPANNTAVRSVTVLPATDLAVATLASTESILHGETFMYSLGVTNGGPDNASGVRVTSVLDPAASYVSAVSTQGSCVHLNGTVTCDLGNLPSGASAVIGITAQANAPGTLVQNSQVTGNQTDPNLANNGAAASTGVAPSADLAVPEAGLGSLLGLGLPVSYTLTVTNHGPSQAPNALLTHAFSPPVQFLSVQSDQGACTNNSGVIQCELNPLPAGQSARIDVVALPLERGPVTYSTQVEGTAVDLNPANNSVLQTATVVILSGPFSNSTPIAIPEEGPAFPYPSTIEVAGVTAAVFNVSVTMSNLTHGFPDDLHAILVGPGGQASYLMANTGGGIMISNVTLGFDQGAGRFLPDATLIESGIYRPTVFGAPASSLPPPAPPGPYGVTLSAFNGTDPNGTWSLYLADDTVQQGGTLAGGWSLTLATLDPIADVALAVLARPDPVAPGDPLTFEVTVTNRGPASSTQVVLRTQPPQGLIWSAVEPSQGNCGPPVPNGSIRCDLGTIPAGRSALVTLVGRTVAIGPIALTFQATARETDLVPDNNSAQAGSIVGIPLSFLEQPQGLQVRRGNDAQFSALATGTDPVYQWLFNGAALAGQTLSMLSLTNVQFDQAGVYSVLASNLLGTLSSQPALLIVLDLPEAVTLPVANLASTGVVLRASVNPNFGTTVAWIEWGPTTGYGRITEPRVLGQGGLNLELSEPLAGLEPDTPYHYRAVAANQLGLMTGSDISFSWSSSPPAFEELRVLPDLSVQLELLGNSRQSYFILASTNLTDWELLGPAEESQPGRFGYLDGSLIAPRFYRIFSP